MPRSCWEWTFVSGSLAGRLGGCVLNVDGGNLSPFSPRSSAANSRLRVVQDDGSCASHVPCASFCLPAVDVGSGFGVSVEEVAVPWCL